MNSSAWDKFRKQQATEREQLQRLVFGMHGLLARCRTTAPTEIELSALAALLHSFYTGVENIFKRVACHAESKRLLVPLGTVGVNFKKSGLESSGIPVKLEICKQMGGTSLQKILQYLILKVLFNG
jgi:hypothetical protein